MNKLNKYIVRIAFADGDTAYRTVVTTTAKRATGEVKRDYVKAGALDLIKLINIKERGSTMSFLILTKSRKKQGEMVALVDRNRFKDHWWTENIEKAVVFTSKEQAQIQCSKLRYNNPKIWGYEKGRKRLNQVKKIRRSNTLHNALCRKEMEWHDDDWYEGIND